MIEPVGRKGGQKGHENQYCRDQCKFQPCQPSQTLKKIRSIKQREYSGFLRDADCEHREQHASQGNQCRMLPAVCGREPGESTK